MTLVVDASALYAQADADEPDHAAVSDALAAEPGALVTTELIAAEADYLILRRLGQGVELDFLQDLAEGTFVVDCLSRDELRAARSVVEQYRDLYLGLADASLVVLAHRYRTRRVATLDQRHFRQIRPMQAGTFIILPAGRRTRFPHCWRARQAH